MDALNEVISFAADLTKTAEEKFADGFQPADLPAFIGPGLQLPSLVSASNRAAIAAAWQDARSTPEKIAALQQHIRDKVQVNDPRKERIIEKTLIALFSILDVVGEVANKPAA